MSLVLLVLVSFLVFLVLILGIGRALWGLYRERFQRHFCHLTLKGRHVARRRLSAPRRPQHTSQFGLGTATMRVCMFGLRRLCRAGLLSMAHGSTFAGTQQESLIGQGRMKSPRRWQTSNFHLTMWLTD